MPFWLAYFDVPNRYSVGRGRNEDKNIRFINVTLVGLLGRPNFILDCRCERFAERVCGEASAGLIKRITSFIRVDLLRLPEISAWLLLASDVLFCKFFGGLDWRTKRASHSQAERKGAHFPLVILNADFWLESSSSEWELTFYMVNKVVKVL